MPRRQYPGAPALGVLALLGACGSVPDDSGARIFPPGGIIRGTVVYRGPRPCSREGHIVGNAILFVFDRRNPPAPAGLATAAVNFADVTGDVLFGNEPRYTGPDSYCPPQAGFTETIGASAPFEIAPLAGGSYEIHAFFDYTGDFLPEFKIRNLPEQGDVGGGDVDTEDALKATNVGNPNYLAHFLPVDVGVPQLPSSAPIPEYVIPANGFVADDVTVTIGAPLESTRPYFFAQGQQVAFDFATMALTTSVVQSSDTAANSTNGIDGTVETDPDSMPILTIPQDIEVLAPPLNPTRSSILFFESRFPRLRLEWGLPSGELSMATSSPFDMQVAPFGQGPHGEGLLVWQNATLNTATQRYEPALVPEGNLPELWPKVVLTKLGLDSSTSAVGPVVVLQAITLRSSDVADQPDSLFGTEAASLGGSLFDTTSGRPRVFPQDHLTVVLRPSVVCFPSPSEAGTLVTPHLTATSADLDCSSSPCVASGTPGQPITALDTQGKLGARVKAVKQGCLPIGRYGIDVIYPDGQAWTVPNEAGPCSPTERSIDPSHLCTRPVLYSQGNRAVVEVVAAKDQTFCDRTQLPAECLGSQ